jgi:hypothetical protein
VDVLGEFMISSEDGRMLLRYQVASGLRDDSNIGKGRRSGPSR